MERDVGMENLTYFQSTLTNRTNTKYIVSWIFSDTPLVMYLENTV